MMSSSFGEPLAGSQKRNRKITFVLAENLLRKTNTPVWCHRCVWPITLMDRGEDSSGVLTRAYKHTFWTGLYERSSAVFPDFYASLSEYVSCQRWAGASRHYIVSWSVFSRCFQRYESSVSASCIGVSFSRIRYMNAGLTKKWNMSRTPAVPKL